MTDDEIIEFAKSFREGMLEDRSSTMMCAAICWPLETLLNLQGLKCRSVTTHETESPLGITNHVWILLEDGRALDPTADQFGEEYPDIYLGDRLFFHQEQKQ